MKTLGVAALLAISLTAGQTTETDGVAALFPPAPGLQFRLGEADPAKMEDLTIEGGTRVEPRTEGMLRYWNLTSHPLRYASGGKGWTSRVHIRPKGTEQRFTWRNQQGFLSTPGDARNAEFTVYVRVHGILDPRRAQITLKVRGGRHTAKQPDMASCVMMTFSPSGPRFGKELVHPRYDYVRLEPRFPCQLREETWYGLKLVSWNLPGSPRKARHQLYLDEIPFENGRPANHWRLFCEYEDIDGKRTDAYDTLADWGGWQTTLRTDGFRDIDFAFLSLREITPP